MVEEMLARSTQNRAGVLWGWVAAASFPSVWLLSTTAWPQNRGQVLSCIW